MGISQAEACCQAERLLHNLHMHMYFVVLHQIVKISMDLWEMFKSATCQDFQDSCLNDKKTQWKDFVTHHKGVMISVQFKTGTKISDTHDLIGDIHHPWQQTVLRIWILEINPLWHSYKCYGNFRWGVPTTRIYNNLHFEPIFPMACPFMGITLFQYKQNICLW